MESATTTTTTTTSGALPEEIDPNLISTQSNGTLVSNMLNEKYVSKPALWFNILWNLIIKNVLVVCCVITYIIMIRIESARNIIVVIYIFFAIFWSIFPYYLRCIMLYEITGISTCSHKLLYSLIGLLCWCIALYIYN
jgi:hypothetical protein